MGSKLQKNRTLRKGQIKAIKGIKDIIQSEDLDTSEENENISSLIELEDKRIATGGNDGNISISSYYDVQRIWKREIHQMAHILWVSSLCATNDNRLISTSWDKTIKIWIISDTKLILSKEIKEHSNSVEKVISLSRERFASCSFDGTIKIWNDDDTYECLSTLNLSGWVTSIFQLKGKEVLVSSQFYLSSPGEVSFWNLNDYTRQHTIKGYYAFHFNHIIELSDGNIALSSALKPNFIIIIDSSSYQIKKRIQMEKIIDGSSSLCVFNEQSFIFASEGKFVQISNEDGKILFHSRGGEFKGFFGIIPLEGGQYFAIQNGKRITIVKPVYD